MASLSESIITLPSAQPPRNVKPLGASIAAAAVMPRPARRALLLLAIARARVLELDAEELEPLRRTSQLPAAGASDLIEVFTLRARVAVPSLFEEAV